MQCSNIRNASFRRTVTDNRETDKWTVAMSDFFHSSVQTN